MHFGISLYPAFDDAAELSDALYKTAFLLQPYQAHVAMISFWRVGQLKNQPLSAIVKLPSYLDPACALALAQLAPKFVEPTPYEAHDGAALHQVEPTLLLAHDRLAKEKTVNTLPILSHMMAAGRVLPFDRRLDGDDCGALQWILARQMPGWTEKSGVNARRFAVAAAARRDRQNAVIFAPGPSLLHGIQHHDFSSAIRITGSSIITSPELISRIQPDFICLVDDHIHAGATLYAAHIRKGLIETLRQSQAILLCRDVHQPIFEQVVPPEWHDRIIGIPCLPDMKTYNVDLTRQFALKSTRSILTMMMVPVAATLASSISLIGCDGRSKDSAHKFWDHATVLEVEKLITTLYEAHPHRKAESSDAIIAGIEADLAQLCSQIEAAGKTIRTVTPSHFAALAARYHPVAA